jgi:hypothetical protein
MRAKRFIALVVVAICLPLSAACPSSLKPPATVTTPAGKAAWNADLFVQRAGELQSAAISANQQGALSDKTAVRIVQFTVGAIQTAKSTPDGWQAAVLTGYASLKSALSPDELRQFAVPLATLDALLAALGGAQ